MKKLILVFLILPFLAKGQVTCLQTMCVAAHAKVGDTSAIGAVFVSSKNVASITFSQIAGPSVALLSPPGNTGLTKPVDTARVGVTNLAAGTYLFKVTATDQSGIVLTGIDSLVVAAATVIPPQRMVTSITIMLFGVPFTIPAGQGTKVIMSDSTTQSY